MSFTRSPTPGFTTENPTPSIVMTLSPTPSTIHETTRQPTPTSFDPASLVFAPTRSPTTADSTWSTADTISVTVVVGVVVLVIFLYVFLQLQDGPRKKMSTADAAPSGHDDAHNALLGGQEAGTASGGAGAKDAAVVAPPAEAPKSHK